MNVWMVNPYGALPGDAWREYRTSLAARAFDAARHEVTWWVSDFDHRSRVHRRFASSTVNVSPRFRIHIVAGRGYARPISFGRIRFERAFARHVCQRAVNERRPDVILLREPALFTASAIVDLADRWSVPLVLDIEDLWPELFHIALPKGLRWMGRLLFDPLYRRRARLLRRADGYIAVTQDYLDLAMSIAPKSYAALAYSGVDLQALRQELASTTPLPVAIRERVRAPGELWAIYAGTLGLNYDIPSIVSAARHLQAAGIPATIFIAGDGPSREATAQSIRKHQLNNCVLLGRLDAATLTKLYARCDVGLCTYVKGSTVSMPLKAFDYFAAGLPIINSLGRDLGAFVSSRKVGLQYVPQDAGSLAHAIRQLAEHPELRAQMAENSARLGEELDCRLQYERYVKTVTDVANHFDPRRENSLS
jgi:glycosyltransferase involved in cell wall biosynthesis